MRTSGPVVWGLPRTRSWGRKDVSVPESLSTLGSWTTYKIRGEQRSRWRGRPRPSAAETRSGLGPGDSRGGPSTPEASLCSEGPSWRPAGRFWVMVRAADVQLRTLFGHWFESQTLQGLRPRMRGTLLRALGVSWAREAGRPSQESGLLAVSLPEGTPWRAEKPVAALWHALPGIWCGPQSGEPESHASPLGQEFLPPQSSQARHPPCPLSGPQDTGKSSHSSSPRIIHEAISTTSPQKRIG